MLIIGHSFAINDHVVRKARAKASRQNNSLNRVVGDWLQHYVEQDAAARNFDAVMHELARTKAGKRFSRDEMNEPLSKVPIKAPFLECGNSFAAF